jgi:hypothetical protein
MNACSNNHALPESDLGWQTKVQNGKLWTPHSQRIMRLLFWPYLLQGIRAGLGRFWTQCKNKDSAHRAASLQDVNGKQENVKHNDPFRAAP